jgi:hypothetical protein
VLLLAAIGSAAALGRIGREGGWIGTTMALLAMATLGRIALVLAITPDSSGEMTRAIADYLPWISGAAWLLASVACVVFAARK